MSTNTFILGLLILSFFVPAAIEDVRTKELDLRLLAVYAILVPAVVISGGESLLDPERLSGMIPGLVLLLIMFVSKGAVGSGDALTVIWLGYSAGIKALLGSLFAAWAMAFVCAAVMMVSGKKKRIPFLPFLGVGFLLVFADSVFSL